MNVGSTYWLLNVVGVSTLRQPRNFSIILAGRYDCFACLSPGSPVSCSRLTHLNPIATYLDMAVLVILSICFTIIGASISWYGIKIIILMNRVAPRSTRHQPLKFLRVCCCRLTLTLSLSLTTHRWLHSLSHVHFY